ncbi:hypothetical protein [Cellulomonas sp. Marseille-Q8402]
MTRKSIRRVVPVVGALVVVSALAACSGGRPGAAAVVDGRTIPTSDVETATSELADVLQGVTQATVLGVLVQEPTIAAHAPEAGVGVSDQQARDALDQQAEASGGAAGQEFSEPSVAVMRYVLQIDALQQAGDAQQVVADLQEDLADLDVTVNPRFGTAGENGTVGETTYPWLVAAPETAPAPAP